MAAWRIGGSIFQGHSRPSRLLLCALVLFALFVVGGMELRHVHAQPLQSDRQSQSGSQPAAQSDAQPDASSDADSSLDDPPPVLPTDPPGWKPEVAAKPTPVPPPVVKAAPFAPSAPTAAASSSLSKSASPIAAAPPVLALIPLPADPRQRQVASECNDLLQMATDLKAAVDKSTKDELSVDVVRKAGQIEQYARKVRVGTQLAAGKQ